MGYTTDFELTIEEADRHSIDEIVKNIEIISGYEGWWDLGVCANKNVAFLSGKWYNYDENMLELSDIFSDVIFTLDGSGEESGDIWRKYYYAGKSMDAGPELVYLEFDEDKLK